MKRLTVCAALAVTPVVAENEYNPFLLEGEPQSLEIMLDRFALWDDCGSINLVVENLNDNAAKIDLTRDRIKTLARSRLRAARVYTEELGTYLYVNVTVTKSSFSIAIDFKKSVKDLASSVSSSATTWNSGGVGTHGQDAGYILQSLSEYVDKFIDEYLRVNAEAC